MGAVKWACKWCEELRPLATFGISLFCIALFAYGLYTLRLWWTDNAPVVEFFGGEISAPTTRPEDMVVVYLHVRKFRDCPGFSQRRLTGDCGEHLLSEAATYRPGGFVGRVTLPFQVPHEVIPGDCAFQTHVWFVCNPIDLWRERHYASAPIPFKVLRHDE
jgi:hypothetical protein